MRIIGGRYKKKKLQPPKGIHSRPTTDQAKEGLFNILDNSFDMEQLTVLDLFAGTGNVTFEFVSRGCEEVTAI